MTAVIRRMIPADRQFVISTWSSSYRMSPYAGMLSMETYADVMHREIARIIDHPTSCVLVAEEPGEVDDKGRPFVYAFGAFRNGVHPAVLSRVPYVYYVYVKAPYRQGRKRLGMTTGYAALLLGAYGIDPARPFTYACRTSYCDTLASKMPRAAFDHLPARYLEHHGPEQAEPATDQPTSQAVRAGADR